MATSAFQTSEELPLAVPASWILSLSLGGSILIHLSALGLLAALILPGGSTADVTGIHITNVDTVLGESGTAFGESVSFMNEMELPEPQPKPASTSAIDLMTAQADPLVAATLAELDSSLLLPDTEFSSGSLAQAFRIGKGKGGAGKGIGQAHGTGTGISGTGTGAGNGLGKGRGGFFGLKVKNKSTVFVVDASRSMNLPHPGPSRTRFNRVKLELLRAISSMSETEKFFIIFFGDGAYPMPADRLMEAEAPVRKRYLAWMANCQAVGRTFPESALLLALQLEPDQVYFLTDGEFDYSVVPGVTAANTEGVPIHSIGFSDNRGENFLMEIARRNNGTYTYISADDDNVEMEDPGNTAISILSPLGTP